MKIFVTVKIGNGIFHKICEAGDTVAIGSGENAVPMGGLGKGDIRIVLFEEEYEITGKSVIGKENVQLRLGVPFSIEEKEIFILAEEYRGFARKDYSLPYEGVCQFGRSSKNDVVITDPHRYTSTHHFTLTAENGIIQVEDCDSKNGLYLNGNRIRKAKIIPGDVLSILDICIHNEGNFLRFENAEIQFEEEDPAEESTEKILVTRAPRLKQELPHGSIQIDPPPSEGTKPEPNWLSILLPGGITIVVAIVLATVMNSKMMMMFSLPMTVGGIIVSVVNYLKQRKQYNKQTETRRRKYAEYLKEKEKTLQELSEKQLVAMRNADPETRGCIERLKKHPERIWQRRAEDEDFAHVRIGSGNVELSVKVTGPQISLSMEEDPLKEKAVALARRYREIEEAPIVCDLSDGRICGVIGKTEDIYHFSENLLVNLCTQHCYTDLQVICLYNSEDEEEFGWIRKLPHLWDSEHKDCHIATNKEDAQALLSLFSDFLKQRKNEIDEDSSYGSGPVFLPQFVFLILEPSFLKKTHPVNQYFLHGSGLGVSLLMTAEKYSQLPKECSTIYELNGDKGVFYQTSSASDRHDFQLDLAEAKEIKRFARKMERLYVEESAGKNAIPSNFTFYDMLGVTTPAGLNISGKWKRSDALRSLAAPVGVGEDGKLVILDLDESRHGPHGLVAGTTGSGKSELLQSYLLGLAVLYHPYDLNFLLIDYKGGGMANQFVGLPHLAGSITNLEENEYEIDRALAALEGEKLRRQKLFAEAGVRTIQDYMAAWKQGKVDVPIPRLIIVVDEFAELKKQRSDFMEALTSTSRIGRSLGIHLILATQKPSGVVNDDIRANSKFRICLKVMNAAESKEVINSSLASKIREPGRAYLRVGEGDVFELFQSGYSGGKTPSGKTQFQEVFEGIRNCWAMENLPSLQPICLPPLEKRISYEPQPGEQCLTIGLLDDPKRQTQIPYRLPLFGGNTLIVGSSQTGKTTLLQTLLRRIAEGFSPQEVSVYIMDFASKTMKIFEGLPHIGGVVTADEDEKLGYLIQMIRSELERRKKLFLTEGISSFDAYREIGKTELPYLVLMIDNLSSAKELYFQEDDSLLTILQSGPGLGVSVVATNFLASSIGYKYLPTFSKRVALFCNDSGEYATVFESCRRKFALLPGRCLVGDGREQFFCQVYLPFEGEREQERVNAIYRFLREAAMQWTQPASPIPIIPEHLTGDEILSRYQDCMYEPGEVVLGLNYADVMPFVLNLREQRLLVIGGKTGSPAIALLRHIVRTCTKTHPGKTVFYLADSITRELEALDSQPDIGFYSFLPDKAEESIRMVERELQLRHQALSGGDRSVLDNSPTLVLVLNGQEVMETVSRDSSAMNAWKNILGKYKSLNACVILLNPENKLISYDSAEVLRSVKENPCMIMFEDLANVKLTGFLAVPRKFSKPADAGTGYYICGGSYVKVKFAVEK